MCHGACVRTRLTRAQYHAMHSASAASAMLRRRFARAAAEGELPASLDPEGMGTFYATVQHGMSILARDGADSATLHAVARHAVASLTAMIERT